MKGIYLLFNMGYGSLVCSKKRLSDRPKWRGMPADPNRASLCKAESKTKLEWEKTRGDSASLPVSWLFLGVGCAIIPRKRTFRATCWYKNQDHEPTDRHFMIIFWCSPGVWKWVFFRLSFWAHFFQQMGLLYIRWKGRFIASIWGMLAWSAIVGDRVTASVTLLSERTSYSCCMHALSSAALPQDWLQC